MSDKDMASAASGTGPSQAEPVVSALRASVPDADRAWKYARRMGKSLMQIAPEDIAINWNGDKLWITASIATTLEASAVIAIIRELAPHLTSHRLMVAGDIAPPPAKPDFSAQMRAFLGDAQGMSAGTAETPQVAQGNARQPGSQSECAQGDSHAQP